MDDVMWALDGLFAAVPHWAHAAIVIVAAASAVTALTPSPADDAFLGKVRRLIEVVALNVGHARPAARDAGKRAD